MSQDPDPEKIVEAWLERDLSLAVANGELPPAFEVDELVDRLSGFVAAGRYPVVVGEPGVGKTAVVYELVRRALAGTGPSQLTGKRILQLSLQRRASALKDVEQMRPEMQQLADALQRTGPTVVPYFRDLHLAHRFDIGPQLVSLAFRLPGPILGEGPSAPCAPCSKRTPSWTSTTCWSRPRSRTWPLWAGSSTPGAGCSVSDTVDTSHRRR